ncbi:MAG TPA: gliding motility-associated C-terminal domain-containing protein [Bacteroidales bacterium]|nr:gliding motility-associated C-terminal domain-containing protein [Bacteroidales bacterium]
MIKKITHTAILFLFILNQSSYSQDCEVPEPPVLKLVSVDPQTGRVEIEWSSSPSAGISAYIVYWYDKANNGWMAVNDTIWNPAATNYEYTTSGTKYQSMDFRVASYRAPLVRGRPGCPSKLSNTLSTIFLVAEADTCLGKITLKWNRYSDVSNPVSGYRISVSRNNGSYVETYALGPAAENHIITDLSTDSYYSFFISATLERGTSTSYRSEVSTFMMRPPQWINADYASTEGNEIKVSFTADPVSEIVRYNLERKEGNGSWARVKELASVNNKILYTDNKIDNKRIYTYRVSAINGCNNSVTVSNATSNIVANVSKPGDNILLKWNNPGRLTGSALDYQVFADRGNGFSSFATISDTTCSIRPGDLLYDVMESEVCFRVEAHESGNIHGINNNIQSSHACFELPVIITVPNIFTPNNDLKNDQFSPVLSFTPAEFLLLITDKQGKKLFETRDHFEKWDGTVNGKPEPEGVYLWFVKIRTPGGEMIFKTGTVTIIH